MLMIAKGLLDLEFDLIGIESCLEPLKVSSCLEPLKAPSWAKSPVSELTFRSGLIFLTDT